jgi:hypothetical protein
MLAEVFSVAEECPGIWDEEVAAAGFQPEAGLSCSVLFLTLPVALALVKSQPDISETFGVVTRSDSNPAKAPGPRALMIGAMMRRFFVLVRVRKILCDRMRGV